MVHIDEAYLYFCMDPTSCIRLTRNQHALG
jgi:hypothetical protein